MYSGTLHPRALLSSQVRFTAPSTRPCPDPATSCASSMPSNARSGTRPMTSRHAPSTWGGGTPSTLSEAGLGRLLAIARSRTPEGRIREWTVEGQSPHPHAREGAHPPRGRGESCLLRHPVLPGRGPCAASAGATTPVKARPHSPACGKPASRTSRWISSTESTASRPRRSRTTSVGSLSSRRSTSPATPCPSSRERPWPRPWPGAMHRPRTTIRRRTGTSGSAPRLVEAGYRQYEISNFAVPGRACLHNLFTWGGGDYLGFGPAAPLLLARGRDGATWEDLDAYAPPPGRGRGAPGLHRTSRRGCPGSGAPNHGAPKAVRRESIPLSEDHGPRPSRDRRRRAGPVSRGRIFSKTERGRVRLADHALFVSDAIFCELI